MEGCVFAQGCQLKVVFSPRSATGSQAGPGGNPSKSNSSQDSLQKALKKKGITYYYSMWHMHGKARGYERSLKNAGLISPFAKEFSITRFAVLSLAVPVAAHGLYDYCCTLGGNLATIVFYGFVLFLYIYCFGKIKKMSGYDMSDERFSNVLVYSKYPGLVERIRQVNEVTSGAEQMQEQINV